MKVICIPVGPIQTNCYFAINEETNEVVIVDPGDWGKRIISYLERESLTPVAILLTHGHFDHIGAVEELRNHYNIKVYVSELEKETLQNPGINLSHTTLDADVYLKDEEVVSFLGEDFKMLSTPGHTPGGGCFYIPKEGILFSGDSLFFESVGRTDFLGGSMSQLVNSLKEKIFCLPEDTKVYPGHMEETTIGHEKVNNPFLQ